MTEETSKDGNKDMNRESNPENFNLWRDVKDRIGELCGAGHVVTSRVREFYVDKEIDQRVEKTIQAVDALADLEKQMHRMKPDVEHFDGQGAVAGAFWSKARLEEKKKLQQKIDKLEKALAEVFERQEFDLLKKLDLKNLDAKPGEAAGA